MFSLVVGWCCGKIPTLAVEARVHIRVLLLTVCVTWASFPVPLKYKMVIGFTNLVEFHLEEIKACVQVPETQADPNPFFFPSLNKLENGMFSILQLFYFFRQRGTGYSLESRTQPRVPVTQEQRAQSRKTRGLSCREFSGRVFKTLRVEFQGSRPRA